MSDPRLDQLTDFTFAYTGGPRFFAGFETLVRTASASGLGSESASGDYIRARTASGAGVGGGSATYTEILPRTATGSGAGTTGGGTSELLIAKRTASASGTGGASVLSGLALKKAAFGSGAGAGSATRIVVNIRSASASGVGASVVTEILVAKRTASAAGTAGQSATAIESLPRTATGSGTGSTGGQVTWNKLFIFRPPVNDSFSWADRLNPQPGDFLLRKLVPGDRAKNVYKLLDGSFTTNQPPDPEDYITVYLGAHNNFVSAEEKADLVSAGYGSYVT
jgi:hypothetical protein